MAAPAEVDSGIARFGVYEVARAHLRTLEQWQQYVQLLSDIAAASELDGSGWASIPANGDGAMHWTQDPDDIGVLRDIAPAQLQNLECRTFCDTLRWQALGADFGDLDPAELSRRSASLALLSTASLGNRGVTVELQYGLWRGRPESEVLAPSVPGAGAVAPLPAGEAVEMMFSWGSDLGGLVLALFAARVSDEISASRELLGQRWRPPTLFVIEPARSDLVGAEIAPDLAPHVARLLGVLAVDATTVAASCLQASVLCLFRQPPADQSGAFYSQFVLTPTDGDSAAFEEVADELVGVFGLVEHEAYERLWDTATDLEMAEVRLRLIDDELAGDALALLNAIIVRFLDQRDVRSRAAMRVVRESVEILRRTLLQIEPQLLAARTDIQKAGESVTDARRTMKQAMDQYLTGVPVEGRTPVADAMLSSPKFDEVVAKIEAVRARESRAERMRTVVNASQEIFADERAEASDALERINTNLALIVGGLALFTVFEFWVEVRWDPTAWRRWLLWSLSVLFVFLLGWLAKRAGLLSRQRALRAEPEELRDLRTRSVQLARRFAEAGRLDDDHLRAATDRAVCLELGELWARLGGVEHEVKQLRQWFTVSEAGMDADGAPAVSIVLPPALRKRVRGETVDVADVDAELLLLEVSLFSSTTLLVNERPDWHDLRRLPRATAFLWFHPKGSVVSEFELNQTFDPASREHLAAAVSGVDFGDLASRICDVLDGDDGSDG